MVYIHSHRENHKNVIQSSAHYSLRMICYLPMASTTYAKLQLNPYSKPNLIFQSRKKDSVKE